MAIQFFSKITCGWVESAHFNAHWAARAIGSALAEKVERKQDQLFKKKMEKNSEKKTIAQICLKIYLQNYDGAQKHQDQCIDVENAAAAGCGGDAGLCAVVGTPICQEFFEIQLNFFADTQNWFCVQHWAQAHSQFATIALFLLQHHPLKVGWSGQVH